jgi:hypothetical protein
LPIQWFPNTSTKRAKRNSHNRPRGSFSEC